MKTDVSWKLCRSSESRPDTFEWGQLANGMSRTQKKNRRIFAHSWQCWYQNEHEDKRQRATKGRMDRMGRMCTSSHKRATRRNNEHKWWEWRRVASRNEAYWVREIVWSSSRPFGSRSRMSTDSQKSHINRFVIWFWS